jgi:hypothetical protein
MPPARREARPRRLVLVVTLTVRRGKLAMFRAFERKAAAVMARHGGAIERSVVVAAAGPGDHLRELHIVTFPDQAALAAYRNDAALQAVAHLREASVVDTQVLVGEDGPDYRVRGATSTRARQSPRS